MPEDTITDPTDPGTRRPKAQPLKAKGNTFIPMKLLDFETEIYLPDNTFPDDPITLFTIYYSLEIVEQIV
jgi:hypothetical protein